MKVLQLRRGPLAVAVATLLALTLPVLSLPGSWDVYTGGVILGATMLVLALAKPPSIDAASVSRPRRWWALGFLGSTGLLVGLDAASMTVALPTMARTFPDATFGGLASVVVAYLVGIAAMAPFAGALAQRFGTQRVLAWGLSLFGLAWLVGGYVDEIWLLSGARLVQGIGVGLMGPTAIRSVRWLFGEERPLAGRICAGMGGLGLVLGAVVGAVVLEWSSWLTTTYVSATLVVVTLAGAHWLVPKTHVLPAVDDPIRVALSTQGIGTLAWAIALVPTHGWASAMVLLPGVLGVAMLGALAVRRVKRGRQEALSLGVATIVRGLLLFVVFGAVFAATFYLQELQRYTPLETGLVLLPLIVGVAAGGLVADWFVRGIDLPGSTALSVVVGPVAVVALGMAAQYTRSWVLMGVALAAMGFAIGLGVATTRRSIARVYSGGDAKMGIAFAMGALGVATIGTLVATAYSDQVVVRAGRVGFPTSVAEAAAEDVTRGLEVASATPGVVGRVLGYVVEVAYGDAFTTTLFVTGMVGFMAACVVAMFSFVPD